MAYGTYQVSDTLAAFYRSLNFSVADFGEENVFNALQELLAAHEAIVADENAEFVEETKERLMASGGVGTVTMRYADEYSTPDAQKAVPGQLLGLPLRSALAGGQWTRKYLQRATLEEINALALEIMAADKKLYSIELRNALYLSSNYTFVDNLEDFAGIPVKRLLNADGWQIPADPWGNTFNGSTHTHYLARVGTFAASDLDAVINTVVEHNAKANIRVSINSAQEAAVRAFSGFAPVTDVRLVQPTSVLYAQVPDGLNMTSTQDRRIGIYNTGGAEIWVKPWAPANYLLAQDMTRKPLRVRTRAGSGNLQMVYEDEAYPLRAKVWEREFGIGVVERESAAVLYVGGTTYADPTIS